MAKVQDKIIVITGGSDGIGAAAARTLHAAGATVVVVGRSPAKTASIAQELGIKTYLTDFADLNQVRQLADELRRDYPRIDVLVNNAGMITQRRQVSTDGNELTLQINHLAPFLLTNLLKDVLIAAKATVITTSSQAQQFGRISLDDLQSAKHFGAFKAYARSKRANILFSNELQRRWQTAGVHSAAFYPGLVRTNFGNGTNKVFSVGYKLPFVRPFLKTPQEGSAPLVWLASSRPGTDWRPGGYFSDSCKPARAHPQTDDLQLASDLWEMSAKLVGLTA